MGGFSDRVPHLLRVGLLVGLAFAIVVTPIGVIAGRSVKAAADKYLSVPGELRNVPVGQTSYVYAADNKTLLTMFYEEYRRYTTLGEISPHLANAVISAEDSRFYEHNGVDFKGLARAFVANQRAGGVEQGASTLTMQYVRMALRDGAQTPQEVIEATEQTPARKIREVRIAVRLEKEMSKQEILERYLNAAYFGHRAFGIHAAAEIYLSKSAKDLTIPEAALLAGLVKAPTAFDPAANDTTAAKDRRDWVLNRMAELKYITPEQANEAKNQPIQLKVTDPPNDCGSSVDSSGYFCDFLKNWWIRQPEFGDNPHERMDKLRRGGYRIVTSIDPHIQTVADNEVQKHPQSSSFANGVVAIEPGTGRVRAMAVNRTFSADQSGNGPSTAVGATAPGNYPNTVAPLLGGAELPGYQAGSTFKFFTMLAALEAGMPLSTAYDSPHKLVSKYPGTPGAPSTCGDRWCPTNANEKMTGKHTMWSGFGKSVNTYFVQLEQAVGAEKAVEMAQRLGLHWRSDIDKQMATPERAPGWGSFTLGVADTTPLEMANAVATLAADGKFCEPTPITSISNADGTPVGKVADTRCHQEIEPSVARSATDAARCVTGYKAKGGDCGDWSTAGGVYGQVGRPVAGKTGTTDNTRAAWFVGYTPQLAAASFMADPDNPFHHVGDGNSQVPVNAVATVLRDGLAGQPVLDFKYP